MTMQTLRLLVLSDIDELLPLCAAFCREDGHAFDEERVRRGLKGLVGSSPYGFALVLRQGGLAVGYAVVTLGWSLESGGIDALLDEVYVRPTLRNQGLGTRLIEDAVDVGRARGSLRIYLEVEAGNDDARRLYERLGWRAEPSQMMLRWLVPTTRSGSGPEPGGRIGS